MKLLLARKGPIILAEVHLAIDLRESAAHDPGGHRTEHAGLHAQPKRVPRSQERPDETGNAQHFQHVGEMDGVRKLFKE